MLQSILQLNDITVEEIFTHRKNIFSIDSSLETKLIIEKINESFSIKPDFDAPPQFKIYNKPSVLTINQHLLNYVGEIYRNTLFNIRELLNSENVQASENRVVVDEPEEVNLETVKNLIQQNFEFFKNYSGIDSRLIDIKKNSFITALCSDEGVSKGEYSHIFVALIKAPQ